MQGHTCYICLAFLQCVFQMCPKLAWPGGCKVTKVAFIRFFSTVHFKMCFQIVRPREGIFALVAFFGFSSLCIFKWIFKSPAIIDLGAFVWRFFTMCIQMAFLQFAKACGASRLGFWLNICHNFFNALCVFGKRGPKMFNFELLFLHGFSSKNREILHKAVLTPQEYEDYFFGKNLRK